MGRLKLIAPVIFILLIGLVSAEEIATAQQEYLLGETLQAEIAMDNFNLAKLSLQDNQSNKVPIGFLLSDLGEKKFISFNLPITLPPGDYFLKAKDQRIIDSVLQDFELSAKITIIEGKGISIDPAIVIIDPLKDEFKIALHNNADQAITANVTAGETLKPARESLQIAPGETKSAFIKYTSAELGPEQTVSLKYLNRSYTVRIILPEKETIPEQEPETTEPVITEPETGGLVFDGPETVEKRANRYTSFSDPIAIKNTAKEELLDIKFSLTGNLADIIELKLDSIGALQPGESAEQFVWANKDKKAQPGVYEGDIIAKGGASSDSLHLKITLEEMELINESVQEPSEQLFNQTRISLLINETLVEEKPNIKKNVTIALAMLAIVAALACFVGIKMKNKTARKRFEDYVQSFRKGRK